MVAGMDVGIIGAGGMGETHLTCLEPIPDVSVRAVADVDEARARGLAAGPDAAVYTDHEAMYENHGGELDAVIITVPPFAHTTQELIAAERGIPFLVEKPLPLSRETVYEIRDAVEAADLVTQVGYQRRYNGVVERARELIGDRELAFISGQRQCSVPDTPWWSSKAKSGGQIFEMSTHDFDLVRYFAGEATTVSAYGGHRVVEEIDFDDATVTAMQHENGVVSHVGATSASPDWNSTFVLVGDGFRLEFDYFDGTLTGRVDDEEIDMTVDVTQRQKQAEAFVEAVRADDPSLPRSPYSDAVRTFELTRAVEDARERDRPVHVGAGE